MSLFVLADWLRLGHGKHRSSSHLLGQCLVKFRRFGVGDSCGPILFVVMSGQLSLDI